MRISLVTPSFNKAAFLEASLRSVLDQRHPNLEYGVVDGASTDATHDILARYKDRLSFCISEPDQGMYDAVAKGFARTSGEIMGYLGADDLHMPWTLSVVEEIFSSFPSIQWITSAYPMTTDAKGRVLKARRLIPPTAASFWRGENLPGFSWWSAGWIQQESTFWRRSLWEKAGGLDSSLKFAGDFDLWCRFMHLADPATVETPLAAFRRHGQQITGTHAQAYAKEAKEALTRHGGCPAGRYASRFRALLCRAGLARRGSTLTYDFARQTWVRLAS
ncbi:MAG: glycosyltransferase [Alphaproteobacteria bacterium]|nr:glycosyltransferase [Alphaproteobacteria bacterium]